MKTVTGPAVFGKAESNNEHKKGTTQGQSKYGYYPSPKDQSLAAVLARRQYQANWRKDHPYKPRQILTEQEKVRIKTMRTVRQRRYRERMKAMAVPIARQIPPQFMRAKHDSCPHCGARFYYVVG